MNLYSFLWLIAGLGLGVLVGMLAAKLRDNQTQVNAATRQAQSDTEMRYLNEQLASVRSTESLLRMELSDLSLSNVRLDTLLEESQKLSDKQQEQFELLSRKTLRTLQEELEQKATREYQQRQEQLDEKLTSLLKPLREVLDQNDKKVQEIEKQHTQDTASLKTHIELLIAQTGQLVGVKDRFVEALSNSKGRGDWGEMELIRLLEHSGLIEGVHYEAQRMENGLRPDITIKLSNQRILYVDAKTILVNLERLLNAGDSDEESTERKRHAAALEKEILSLNLKSYESQCKESIDFVVLYVPRESMLRAALEERPALMELAFQRRVLLASPLILMSILKTVSYGWDQAQLSEKAREIQELGKEMHKRSATFLDRFVRIGERIEALSGVFDDAKTSLTGRMGMLPQLKKFEDYGCKSEKSLPKGLNEMSHDEEESTLSASFPAVATLDTARDMENALLMEARIPSRSRRNEG